MPLFTNVYGDELVVNMVYGSPFCYKAEGIQWLTCSDGAQKSCSIPVAGTVASDRFSKIGAISRG